jgi:hypothetical protein
MIEGVNGRKIATGVEVWSRPVGMQVDLIWSF